MEYTDPSVIAYPHTQMWSFLSNHTLSVSQICKIGERAPCSCTSQSAVPTRDQQTHNMFLARSARSLAPSPTVRGPYQRTTESDATLDLARLMSYPSRLSA